MATMTEEPELALARLPDRFEVVNGEIVEVPPVSFYSGEVADLLDAALTRYLIANDIGRSRAERLFRIPLPDDRSRNRSPDLAFVSYDRWPRDRAIPFTGNGLDVVPEVAVEVSSPGDSGGELIAKAREYLGGGVRLVWLIYPEVREVHAYGPGGQVRVFLAADELEAPDVLPGFRVPVASLFPPVADPPTTAAS